MAEPRPERTPERSTDHGPAPDARHLRLVPAAAAPARLHPRLRTRDPAWIRRALPVLGAWTDVWFRAEVEGTEHLTAGPSLLVSTHNGSLHTPDMYTLMVAFWRRLGVDAPGYGLMHRAAFRVPLLGRFLQKVGALPASPDNARLALRAGFPVLVCPGGDLDALKPWRDRHRVTFGERRGFVRLAIAEQVPIIPVVSVGAHETVFVLSDGRRLARALPLARWLRIKSVPLAFGLPFGVTPAGLGNLPLPTKVRQRILAPIRLDAAPEQADDPATVARCFAQVRDTMQAAVDELAAARRWPVLG